MSSFSTQTFFELARNPREIGAEHLQSLEEIVREYPAFTSARMLLLGGLKNTGSYKFNGKLRVAAAHVQQRTALFRFIVETLEDAGEGSKFAEKQADRAPEEVAIGEGEHIDPKPEPIDTQKETADAAEVSPKTGTDSQGADEEDGATTPTSKGTADNSKDAAKSGHSPDIPPIGSPLTFSRREMHSFSEWLSLLEMAPVQRRDGEREEPETAQIPEERSEDSIIARFLAAQPKIKAPERSPRNVASSTPPSSQPTNQLMTETLARVYEEQGLYERAITAYEILILKYPEKSSFFADRIRELKLLTSNRA